MNIFSRIRNRLSHAQIMALGFLMVIITGTILLMLPVSSRTGQWTPFIKALFTSVSSTCVTGLVVVDTFSYWTVFGQLVILVMIQIGGLGFISIGVIFALFFNRRIGLANRTLIQESVNSNVLKDVREHMWKEQRHLCAYCMRKIDSPIMERIEHCRHQDIFTHPVTDFYSIHGRRNK